MTTEPMEEAIAVNPMITEKETKPKALPHAGFDNKGACLSCGEKIRTNIEGAVFCPISQPKCPRNKK